MIDLTRFQTLATFAKNYPSKRSGKLGVTVSYLHQLRKRGMLPAKIVQIDGVWFVDSQSAA
jgi:hypothetical protein